MKRKKLILVFFLFAGMIGVSAQSIVVQMKDGAENDRKLNVVQKITFASGNVMLTNTSGTKDSFSIGLVRKLYFKDVPIIIENNIQNEISGKISAYPNPAEDLIHLQNIPEGNFKAQIFGMDGKIVLQATISSDNPEIGLETLNQGFYFLKVNNQVIKFIKL